MKSAFAEIFSSLRREKGLSQRRAAADLGVSQALLSHYENNAREPKLDFVIKVCDYYGVSADYLLGRIDERDLKTLSAPRGCDGASRFASSACDVFKLLDSLSNPELFSAAADYLSIPVKTVANLLDDPDARYDPARDAEFKMAEAALLKYLREAADRD